MDRNKLKGGGSEKSVSIIIPTYNAEETLERCLRSIHDQSYRAYNVIVVDNFSRDDTLKIARRFGVSIIQRKGSPALARNIGITSSTSEYVFFLDSDQILSRAVVEECVTKCETEAVDMVRIPEVFVGKGLWGSCSAAWKNCYHKVERGNVSESFTGGEPRFFEREQIAQAGMLNDDLLWGEDYDLYKRMKKMNMKETSCSARLYHCEPASVRRILLKILRYGESMPAFREQTEKHIFWALLRNSVVTLKEIFKDYRRSPNVVVGCAVLLFLKSYSLAIGLVSGSLGY
jgi:glycosyltransferase involved in cell wall biosynthesis